MRNVSSKPEQEERLTGGNTAESVVRLGSTVRKPVTLSTSTVQSFVMHLRSVGFEGSPKPFGIDDQGRQVWEYVPGPLWHKSKNHTSSDLRRVGALIKDLHDAAASFKIPKDAQWNRRYEQSGHDLICHNDLAPWNLVCGDSQWAFIDWDAAAPATRLWDLAWTCISFPPFTPGCDLATVARAMGALLSGYSFDSAELGELIRLMSTRAKAEYDLIVGGAREGQQPWVRLHAEAHHQYWGPVAEYIERNASTLECTLLSLHDPTSE